MAALLAFGASVGWGLGDFLGGVESRRFPVIVVVAVAQAVGLLLVAGALLVAGGAAPAPGVVGIAALSGVAQTAGIAAYYRGLSTGAMGVVGPIAATAAVMPLIVGLATGERPTAPQSVGMVLAVAGVVTAAYHPSRPGVGGKRVAVGVGMALLAALAFGTFFTLIGIASEEADLTWVVFVNRVAAVALLAVLVALFARTAGARDPSAAPPAVRARDALAVAAIGVLSVAATFLFAGATTLGLLSVVSVLGALYPVTTVLLAAVVLHERIHGLQRTGTVAALVGVALIAGFAR